MKEEAPGDHAGKHDNGPEHAAVHVRVGLGLKRGSSKLCFILPLLFIITALVGFDIYEH